MPSGREADLRMSLGRASVSRMWSQGERLSHACDYLLDLAGCRLGGVHRSPSLVAAAAIHAAQLLFPEHADQAPPVCTAEDLFYHRWVPGGVTADEVEES